MTKNLNVTLTRPQRTLRSYRKFQKVNHRRSTLGFMMECPDIPERPLVVCKKPLKDTQTVTNKVLWSDGTTCVQYTCTYKQLTRIRSFKSLLHMDYTYLEARGRVGTASVCHRCGPNLHAFNGGGNWSTQINPPKQGKACQHCGSNPRPSNHHVVMKLQSTEVYLLSILHGKLGKTNRQTRKEKLVAVYIIYIYI